jgi:mitochondrial fission protein ELM1
MGRILILTAGRTGDFRQMMDVAEATGLPCEVRQLSFQKVANWKLALWPRRYLVAGAESLPANLKPSDTVLVAENSACALAASMRRSGLDFGLVCIGRPRGHFGSFDLIISSPHHRMHHLANAVELSYPPHLPVQGAAWRARNDAAGIKNILLLVGGTSRPEVLDAAACASLAILALQQAAVANTKVTVATSPRTGTEATEVLSRLLAGTEVIIDIWKRGERSNYARHLTEADHIFVTSDSVSMLTEAMLTGKACFVIRLPRKPELWQGMIDFLWKRRWFMPLFNLGLVEAKADRSTWISGLIEAGLVCDAGQGAQPSRSETPLPTVPDAARLLRNVASKRQKLAG